MPCDLILDNPQESSNTVDYSQKELNKDEDIYIENDFDNSNHKSQPEEDDEAEKDEFNTEISNYVRKSKYCFYIKLYKLF